MGSRLSPTKNPNFKNMFIMIDGIDGSGKSTVINAWAKTLANAGKKVFFLKPYWLEHRKHPSPEEIKEYDVIVSAEPTFVGIGKKIRDILIREGSATPRTLAESYAEDRLVLYRDLLIPLLETGKIVLQDRGVSTSLCYQPLHDPVLTADDIASLHGNAFALDHAPNHLVIVDTPVDDALRRIGGREKQDHAVFEKKQFLEKARSRFLDQAFQKFFTDRGTRIHVLNGGKPIDIMKQEALTLLNTIV